MTNIFLLVILQKVFFLFNLNSKERK